MNKRITELQLLAFENTEANAEDTAVLIAEVRRLRSLIIGAIRQEASRLYDDGAPREKNFEELKAGAELATEAHAIRREAGKLTP